MKVVLLFLSCLACFVSQGHAVSDPGDFTRAYVNLLKKRSPHLTVTIVANLELRVQDGAKTEQTVYLQNAYDTYKLTPQDGHAVLARYIDAMVGYEPASASIDRNRIVPVIKDRDWLSESQAALKARGMDTTKLNYFAEDYNALLVIHYAEDSPKNIRYLGGEDITKLGIKSEELRSLAVGNLQRLIPKIELHGTSELYLMTAGGDYEASLLLFEKIWTSGQAKVDGEIVVAVPSRDLLLITGSKSPTGIAKLKKMAADHVKTAPYRLTSQLFVFRGGKFVPFNE